MTSGFRIKKIYVFFICLNRQSGNSNNNSNYFFTIIIYFDLKPRLEYCKVTALPAPNPKILFESEKKNLLYP